MLVVQRTIEEFKKVQGRERSNVEEERDQAESVGVQGSM